MGIFSKLKTVFKKEDVKSKTYEKGLSKTRKGFVNKLSELAKNYDKINDNFYEELEELLINADIGVSTVIKFMEKLQKRVIKEQITNPKMLIEIIVDELFIIYVDNDILDDKIKYNKTGPTVLLFVGVNGVGKTTTIAKLASKFINENKKVLLVAADTFRAGAVEQLSIWADKLKCEIVKDDKTKDPSAVVYQGLEKAKNENFDIVLIDTAGRLQNKVNLMKELEKINNVANRIINSAPNETFLVIDATTGQNAISQAKSFKEITNLTGIILTKLDGTAKCGIVLGIKNEVGVPVKYIGLGESKDDLMEFDIEKYIYGLFKDLM